MASDVSRCPAVLVVLCGLPGGGKTTLARRLEAWLGAEEGGSGGGGAGPMVRFDRLAFGGNTPVSINWSNPNQEVRYVGFDAIEAGLRSEGSV